LKHPIISTRPRRMGNRLRSNFFFNQACFRRNE
jgi:hypothetical protein